MTKEEINLGSLGSLSVNQLIDLFGNLPIDIIFVDKEDKVLFYSKGKGAASDFSTKVVGNDLLEDHPVQYRKIVGKHIEAFKNKVNRQMEFLDRKDGKIIYTVCYGIYDSEDNYTGCMEVIQEVGSLVDCLKQKK